ncbi:hypothetical protein UY3_17449 [Chelonia mydas]|uniref:Uncharacterized protein n=1 Tax=Chelonia mydas TaxID=8469 RepID=M7ALX1_CHEMY|nr:hypothetical protein UY3_17449 [Chelonia mydas]
MPGISKPSEVHVSLFSARSGWLEPWSPNFCPGRCIGCVEPDRFMLQPPPVRHALASRRSSPQEIKSKSNADQLLLLLPSFLGDFCFTRRENSFGRLKPPEVYAVLC